MKQLCKCVVGSRLHRTNNEQSDWDYRGIYIDDLKEVLSPFRVHKTASWIEGQEDNTAYELREFCKLATKGNATAWEVFKSDIVIETSPEHQELQQNWMKFMDTQAFIRASRGYASNQYKKALSYDDVGEQGQLRTAKFIIAFLRVMWQCEQFLLTGEFHCSLEICPHYGFIKQIKGVPREELDIPLCFAKMEEMNQKLYQAEEWCRRNTSEAYNHKPDVEWIESFLYRTYIKDAWQEWSRLYSYRDNWAPID